MAQRGWEPQPFYRHSNGYLGKIVVGEGTDLAAVCTGIELWMSYVIDASLRTCPTSKRFAATKLRALFGIFSRGSAGSRRGLPRISTVNRPFPSQKRIITQQGLSKAQSKRLRAKICSLAYYAS